MNSVAPTSHADGPTQDTLEAGPLPAPAMQPIGRRGVAVAEAVPSAVAYRLCIALGVVALAASATSFFIPNVLGGPGVAQGNLRGTALVIMVLVVPVLFTSNVPGPARALRLAGAPLMEIWPVAVLAGNVRLGVAAISYDGRLRCGIHFDDETVPGAVFSRAMQKELARLVREPA